MLKKIVGFLTIIAGLSMQAIDVPVNDINILNKTDNQVFFIAWRGSSIFDMSKSNYERVLPGESTVDSSTGRTVLQAELGKKIPSISVYKKAVNDSQVFKVTGSRITVSLNEDGLPVVKQEGTLSGNLRTVEIKNNSDHVLFIAWTKKFDIAGFDVGKYKSTYSRFVPSKDSKTFHTAFNVGDSIQIEVGQKADKNYDTNAKKHNLKITKKRVDLNIDANGNPLITQE